jgi:uncharacterized protein YcbK (DUF882 family)
MESTASRPPATTLEGLTRRGFLGGLVALGATALLPARAAGGVLGGARGERRISLVHTHTGERLATTYWGDGTYLDGELARVEAFLRDFRTGERHAIDPALLDQLHAVAEATGTGAPFQVISGYRSPRTNEALRQERGGQARHSLHMVGQAIDVRLADVRTGTLRDAALELGLGGVGFYPGQDFVHLDTGRVRRW